jgi:hypothetical protein
MTIVADGLTTNIQCYNVTSTVNDKSLLVATVPLNHVGATL